jgi:type I restriction enzyme R subunit
LEDAREAVKALCEPVLNPKAALDYFHYFCAERSGNAIQLKENEPKRLKLYKFVAKLVRAYANVVNELAEAGYNSKEIANLKTEVKHYSDMSEEMKRNSGDYIDLKAYEPDMRFLIDTYINAENSKSISTLGDQSLVEVLVEKGAAAIDKLSETVRKNETAVAETIENNVRRLIVDESPVDPAYYEKISELLDKLIEQRREGVVNYKDYLAKIIEIAKQATARTKAPDVPEGIKTAAQLALYNNLGNDESLALKVDAAILKNRQDGWRNNTMKTKLVRIAIKPLLSDDEKTEQILELAKKQNEY